jgi:hypothetical protein
MTVISLKLSEEIDAQLTEQDQRRRLSMSELVRRKMFPLHLLTLH